MTRAPAVHRVALGCVALCMAAGLGCAEVTRVFVTVSSTETTSLTSLSFDFDNAGLMGGEEELLPGVTASLPISFGIQVLGARAGTIRVCVDGVAELGLLLDGCTTETIDVGGLIRMEVQLVSTPVPGTCGDGIVNTGFEECDGADLAGFDCVGLGYASGVLACRSDCQLDVSDCEVAPPGCDDGVLDPGEECDGADFAMETCLTQGFGFTGGVLTCDASCQIDVSSCTGPSVCTPSQPYCDPDGRTVRTCNAFGTAEDTAIAPVTCSYLCDTDHCVYVSNVPEPVVNACASDVAPFAVTIGVGEVAQFLDSGGMPELDVNGALAIPGTIVAQANGPPLAVFCIAAFDVQAAGSIWAIHPFPWVPVLLVQGPVTLEDYIEFNGFSGASGWSGATGGAGGSPSMAGPGAGGGGGASVSVPAPGGGGGGHGGTGGAGGLLAGALPGGTGGPGFAAADLVPISGGGGGGGGSPGMIFTMGESGGGGAGGALHVVSWSSVTLGAGVRLLFHGGPGANGDGCDSGGGGGGAGGALLIEAPLVVNLVDPAMGGILTVTGGDGGASDPGGCQAGGIGASFLIDGGDGADAPDGVSGSGGGGGAAGVIRINSLTPNGASDCTGAVPVAACTVGSLRTVP